MPGSFDQLDLMSSVYHADEDGYPPSQVLVAPRKPPTPPKKSCRPSALRSAPSALRTKKKLCDGSCVQLDLNIQL